MLSGLTGSTMNAKLNAFFSGKALQLLNAIDEPLTNFGEKAKDEVAGFMKCIESTSNISLLNENRRRQFSYRQTIDGKHPKKCYLFTFLRDNSKSSEFVNQFMLQDGRSKISSFAPRKKVEELFQISKDPETLDDSDIDNLLCDDEFDEPMELFKEKIRDLEVQKTYLLITEDSLYLAGECNPTKIFDGINDCNTFDTCPGTVKSFVLITTLTGWLHNIYMKDPIEKAICMQSMNLGREGSWFLAKTDHSNHFVAVNRDTGNIKFLTFETFVHFELINNLTIDDARILDCVFLTNKFSKHLILFVPTIKSERLVYFCIQWDPESPVDKEVSHLPYLTELEFEISVPIGNHKCLVFFHGEIHLVSASQIFSGETTFHKFHQEALRNVCSFYDAPLLLKKLQLTNDELFGSFTACTIVSTREGNIIACLINDDDNVQFYSLTRFKGLKGICSASEQRNQHNEYDMVVISFGRTLCLTIDIRKAKLLSGYSYVQSLNGVVFKHTLDSSTEQSENLLVVAPLKIGGRFNTELWTTSSIALTQVRTQFPVRKLNTICRLQEFQLFCRLEMISISELGASTASSLLGEDGEDNHEKYLLFGTDDILASRAYILDVSGEAGKLVEMRDLLCGKNELTIELFFPCEELMVQVTEQTVYVESFETNLVSGKVYSFSPGWKIEGVSHLNEKVIIWNVTHRRFSSIDNIRDILVGGVFHGSEFIEHNLDSFPLSVEFLITEFENDRFSLLITAYDALILVEWECILGKDEYSPYKPTVVHPGKCRSLKWFAPHICFIDNDSNFVIYNVRRGTKRIIKTNYGSRDYRLRHSNSNDGVFFSPQEVTCFSSLSHTIEFCDLKLPHQSKFNPILDVQVDKSLKRLFVLYHNGLQVFEMSYFSWNYSTYLLRSTKSVQKETLFVRRLNRMIVVNLKNNEWDCVKLSDGKTLALDPLVLSSSKGAPLQQVIEIPGTDRIIPLVLNFKSFIKLVNIVPQHGKLLIQEKFRLELGGDLFPCVEVNQTGDFYVLQLRNDQNTKEAKKMIIWKLKVVESSSIESIGCIELNINHADSIKTFKLVGKGNIIMRDNIHDMIFLFDDFDDIVAKENVKPIAINHPPALKFHKICVIDHKTFLVIYHCEGVSEQKSELLFYHLDDMSFQQDLIENSDIESNDCFRQSLRRTQNDNEPTAWSESGYTESTNSAEQSDQVLMRSVEERALQPTYTEERPQVLTESFSHPRLELNEMDEMDEIDAFEIERNEVDDDDTHQIAIYSLNNQGAAEVERSSLNQSGIECHSKLSSDRYLLNRPYTSIKLDKLAKDVSFNPGNSTLHVLADDGSIIVFERTSQIDKGHNGEPMTSTEKFMNSGYKIPTQELENSRINTGHRFFDEYGRFASMR